MKITPLSHSPLNSPKSDSSLALSLATDSFDSYLQQAIVKIEEHGYGMYLQDGGSVNIASLLLMLAQDKTCNQIVQRLKDTPDYLEQIAEEQKQQRMITKKHTINEEQAIFAIKASKSYFEEIIEKSQSESKELSY